MIAGPLLLVLHLSVLTCLCRGQTSDCLYSYNATNGTVTSPNYPRSYSSYSNCTYTVSTSTISSISLTIRNLALESALACNFDWVEVGCISHSVSVPVRYCGTASNLAPIVFAPCKRVVIWFRSDGSVVSTGFSIDYRITPLDCGGNCALVSNFFGYRCNCNDSSASNNSLPTAPSQPTCTDGCNLHTSTADSYPYCYCQLSSYRVTTQTTCPPGCYYEYDFYSNRICRCTQLTTEQQCRYGCTRMTNYTGQTYCSCPNGTRFSCSYGCYYDRDYWGYGYCNCPVSTQPPIWCSPGCVSDVNVYGNRYCRCPTTTLEPCYSPCYYQYNYTYSYSGQRYCYCPPVTTQPPRTGCDSTHNDPSGVITSPNYPSAYPKGTDCYQYINVPMSTSMTIQLLDISLYYGYSYSCNYEYIEITGCDNNVVIVCTSSTVPTTGLVFHCTDHTTTTIKFHSYSYSNYDTYRGFKLSYRAGFISNCSETSSYLSQGSTGTITSPNFPSNFPGHSQCYNYLFTSDDAITIQIMFEQLSLESSETCGNVFLMLTCHDQNPMHNRTVCGSKPPPTMTVSCRTLQIWFKSNSTTSFSPRYFKLRYMATTNSNQPGPPTNPFSAENDHTLSYPLKLGLTLGAGVGGFLFILLIVIIIGISVRYRRQIARQEQRHLDQLTVVCSNLRNGGRNPDGNVTFSRNGAQTEANPAHYNHPVSGPPSYSTEPREVGRRDYSDAELNGLDETTDETMLIA